MNRLEKSNLRSSIRRQVPFRRSASVVLVAALLTCIGHAQTTAPVAADTGQPWNWNDLKAWSTEQGPAVRLARLKEHVNSSNLQLVESDTGTRLVAAGGVTRAKEPVTDTVNRSYTRVYGQAGVRWSFLGADEARRRNVLEARAEQLESAAQVQLLQAQAQTELGRLYVRYLRSQQREQVAQAFLASRQREESRLQRRMNAGNMLKAEGLELMGYFEAAQERLDREKTLQAAALRQMGFLSGRTLRAQHVPALALGNSCTSPAVLQDALATHPALEAARHAMQSASDQAQYTKFGGMEGGVQLSQSLSKDLNGSAGHATAVAVDVSIPLQWRAHKEALSSKLQAQYNEASELHAQTEHKLLMEQQAALEAYNQGNDALRASAQRYATAAESWRVAQLRANASDGDGIAARLKARNGLYDSAIRHINTAEAADLASMDLLYYAGACQLQVRNDDPAQRVLPRGSSTPKPPEAKPPQGGDDKKPDAHVNQAPSGTGWYAWKGWQWVEQPNKINQLPQGSKRLLIAFTKAELAKFSDDAQAKQKLSQLAQSAKQRGITLELLLGEPTWVLPKGRGDLLALLRRTQNLPFSMIHLDLERSQLPKGKQKDWSANTLATLREASAQSRIPLSLTTHHRELRQKDFLRDIKRAGVKEVIPMIYSANAQRTVSVVRQLPQMPKGLKLAVAQSIEKALPPEESRFRSGRRQSLAHWKGIEQTLRKEVPGFQGIIVQSWEDYMEAQP